MQRFIRCTALTVPLFIIGLVVFVWSGNLHFYPIAAYAISFLVILVFAMALFLAGILLKGLWEKFTRFSVKSNAIITGLLLGLAVTISLRFFFYTPLRAAIGYGPTRSMTLIVISIVITILYYYYRLSFIRFFNLFMIIWTAISLFMIAKQMLLPEKTPQSEIRCTFKKHPNIYLFWLESYTSPTSLRNTFRIDNKYFYDYLKNRGFNIYDNIYANSGATLPSMADFFSMRLDSSRDTGMLDTNFSTRLLIGGAPSNSFLKVLKENGYFTSFITGNNDYYHGGQQGMLLDHTDYHCFSTVRYLHPFRLIDRKRFERIFESTTEHEETQFTSLKDSVIDVYQLATRNHKPLFISFKGGVFHTDTTSTWRDGEKWLDSGVYQAGIQTANEEIREIVDWVLETDDNYVIILIGDHGPWRLRRIWEEVNFPANGKEVLANFLNDNGESMVSLMEDIFGIFLAIGSSDGTAIVQNGSISTVNIPYFLFSYLSEDKSVLSIKQPSKSFLLGEEMIADGTVLMERSNE